MVGKDKKSCRIWFQVCISVQKYLFTVKFANFYFKIFPQKISISKNKVPENWVSKNKGLFGQHWDCSMKISKT